MHLWSPWATSNYCSNTTVATMHHAKTSQNEPHTVRFVVSLEVFGFFFVCLVFGGFLLVYFIGLSFIGGGVFCLFGVVFMFLGF